MAGSNGSEGRRRFERDVERAYAEAYAEAEADHGPLGEVDPVTGEVVPGEVSVESLLRLGASAAWHTSSWAARTGLGIGRRVLRASTSPDEAVAFARDVITAGRVMADGFGEVASGLNAAVAAAGEAGQDGHGLRPRAREAARGIEGVVRVGTHSAQGVAETLASKFPERSPTVVNGTVVEGRDSRPDPAAELRRRGQQLLERSRDVWSEDDGHPAYARIIDSIAPDEARILVLLLRAGPQPTVDVRTGGPLGMMSSQLIAPGLSMIGARSGCRHLDRVPAYLNNLFRLGLIWFSSEPLADPLPYQVVEAQPDVLEAMGSVRFAKVVRRSIHLTPFGEDFCRAALVEDAELGDLPEHRAPDDGTTGPRTHGTAGSGASGPAASPMAEGVVRPAELR